MTYATEAELIAYAAARGETVTGTAILLTKAHDYIESLTYAGVRAVAGQANAWPRIDTGIILDDGQEPAGDSVPYAIKQAEMMAALIYNSGGDPIGAISRAVKKEKVDVVEVEYADNAAPVVIYPALSRLLAPYVKPGSMGGSFVVYRG